MNADGSDIHRIASGPTVGGCPDTSCVTPSGDQGHNRATSSIGLVYNTD